MQRTAQIDQTTRLLVKLMRNRNLDLEQAMAVFELSRDDKQMYRRIIGGRQAKNKKKSSTEDTKFGGEKSILHRI